MIELLAQDLIVTSVAASAAVVLGRRVIGAVRPSKGHQPACPSCASGAAACAKPHAGKPSNSHSSKPSEVHPLTLVR